MKSGVSEGCCCVAVVQEASVANGPRRTSTLKAGASAHSEIQGQRRRGVFCRHSSRRRQNGKGRRPGVPASDGASRRWACAHGPCCCWHCNKRWACSQLHAANHTTMPSPLWFDSFFLLAFVTNTRYSGQKPERTASSASRPIGYGTCRQRQKPGTSAAVFAGSQHITSQRNVSEFGKEREEACVCLW